MDFAKTLPELADLNEQLPHPNTLAEAHWLAEVACICHRRLSTSHQAPAEFWLGLDADETKRLERFLRDADDGVSNLANDLWHHRLREGEVARQHHRAVEVG